MSYCAICGKTAAENELYPRNINGNQLTVCKSCALLQDMMEKKSTPVPQKENKSFPSSQASEKRIDQSNYIGSIWAIIAKIMAFIIIIATALTFFAIGDMLGGNEYAIGGLILGIPVGIAFGTVLMVFATICQDISIIRHIIEAKKNPRK